MIAILGGTFDPIHHGHLRVALEVADRLQPDKVLLIPCGNPAHRTAPIATAQQRLTMLDLAIAGEPRLSIDTREIESKRLSYTLDTLRDMRKQYAQQSLCLIIGADAYQQLDQWYCWTELFDYAHLLVVQRPGYMLEASAAVLQFTEDRASPDCQALHESSAGLIYFMEIPFLQISATRIRAMIATGKNVRYLLPDMVYRWLQENSLYQ